MRSSTGAPGRSGGLVLEVAYGRGFPPFAEGDIAVLHPRFTDFTAPRYVDRLLTLDGQPGNAFIRLLRDPGGFAAPIPEPEKVVQDAEDLALGTGGFTPSQARAFRQVLTNRLTLVWGRRAPGRHTSLQQPSSPLSKPGGRTESRSG